MIQAYEREPYRRELDSEVTAVGDDGGRSYAVLADTVLYPEGGGQPADRGWLMGAGGEVVVEDVRRHGSQVRHYLTAAVAPGPVTVVVDWPLRFDRMQQHTAQHLLSALAADRFGWETTSFHLGGEVCDVELDAAPLAAGDLAALEEAVAAEVRAARPVTTRRVPPEALAELPVRSRGLPEGHRGDVRLVEVAGLDLATCGGTHLASTAEIEVVKLLDAEPLRGGTRLRWLAGGRVRGRLGEREALAAALRRLVGAGDDELLRMVAAKLDQLRESSRRERTLEGRLADAVADRLAASSEPVLAAHFEVAGGDFLQQVARRFAGSEHPGVALLTADAGDGALFALAAGGGFTGDPQAAGRAAAAALGARGGGSGRIFQGKAASLAGRDAALAAVAGTAGSRGEG